MNNTSEKREEVFYAILKGLKKELRGVAKVTLSEIPKKREVEKAVQIRINGADYSTYLGKETIIEKTSRLGGVDETVKEIGLCELKYFIKHSISGLKTEEIEVANKIQTEKEV